MLQSRWWFLLVALVLVGPSPDVSAQPSRSLSEILREVRELIGQERITDALELLDEVRVSAAMLERETLILQEEFLWEAAMLQLEFANHLTNREQYLEYARRAYVAWKDYVGWYHNLSVEDKKRLGSNHTRIKAASAHLGNSIIRMGEPRTLFREYADIHDVSYLGTDAIELWKHWLYACPEMQPVKSSERSAELRRRKICDEKCKEDWLAYGETLKEWASVEFLRTSVRERKLREADQIKQEAERCLDQ